MRMWTRASERIGVAQPASAGLTRARSTGCSPDGRRSPAGRVVEPISSRTLMNAHASNSLRRNHSSNTSKIVGAAPPGVAAAPGLRRDPALSPALLAPHGGIRARARPSKREVAVERPLRDAGPRDHLVHADVADAAAREEVVRGLEDPLSRGLDRASRLDCVARLSLARCLDFACGLDLARRFAPVFSSGSLTFGLDPALGTEPPCHLAHPSNGQTGLSLLESGVRWPTEQCVKWPIPEFHAVFTPPRARRPVFIEPAPPRLPAHARGPAVAAAVPRARRPRRPGRADAPPAAARPPARGALPQGTSRWRTSSRWRAWRS